MRKARAVPLPRLLDENMREVCRLHPSVFSAVVKLTPLSTVSITLPEGEPVLMPRQWVEVFGPYGTLGIYRVSKPRRVYGQQQQASMEHGITTLGDDLTPKETTLTGTLRSIMETLLSYQSARRWVLGEAPDAGGYTLEVNRTKVLEAVMNLLKQAPEYALTFDQTSTPWRVSVKALSASPLCECRLSRNTSNVAETLDDSSLLTRVYSAALPGGYIDGPTVEKWGVVAEDLGVADDAEQAKAEAYARELLESRKNPAVSLEVDGLYLARITGESMDALRVGALCRIALPRYGMTADERILECRFPDLLSAPERVRITLSSQPKDTSRTLADLRKSANSLTNTTLDQGERIRSHGGSISRLDVELEKTYEYADLVNGNLTEFENYVGIQLDEVNAEIRLKASQKEMDELGQRLSTAEININGAKAEIELKASQEETDRLGQRLSTAESTLTVQAGEISAKVNKDGVVSAINLSPEEALILAKKINLSGYVTASTFEAEIASINNIFAGYSQAENLHVNGSVTAQTAQFTNVNLINYDCEWKTLKMGDITGAAYLGRKIQQAMNLEHSHAVVVNDDGTITLAEVSSSGGSFRIADTKAYKDGVSAAAKNVSLSSPGWVNGTNVVKASNGKSLTVELPAFSTSGGTSFNSNHKTTVHFSTPSVNVPLKSVEVDASSVYDAGYNAGYQDAFDAVTVGYSDFTITNPARNTFYAKVKIRAKVDGNTAASDTISKTQTINVGQ